MQPLASDEAPSLGPFCGIPNVIFTDAHGRGTLACKLLYCPWTPCGDTGRCPIAVNLDHHFDHMVGPVLALCRATACAACLHGHVDHMEPRVMHTLILAAVWWSLSAPLRQVPATHDLVARCCSCTAARLTWWEDPGPVR